jgi:hypothetical protein
MSYLLYEFKIKKLMSVNQEKINLIIWIHNLINNLISIQICFVFFHVQTHLNFSQSAISGRQHCFISRTTEDREMMNRPKDREFSKPR